MCRSRDGSAPQSRVRIHRSRWFCSRWRKRVAVPRQARHSPHAIALSHWLNRSWSRYEKRRQALAPAARQGSAQAGPAALAPRRRGTRILQSERDSPPLSTSPPHTPRNDRSRGVPAARLPPLSEAMSCNARRCRKAPSLAAGSSKWGAKAPPTMFSALAMPGGIAATSAAARPILQLARKVFDNSTIASVTMLWLRFLIIRKPFAACPPREVPYSVQPVCTEDRYRGSDKLPKSQPSKTVFANREYNLDH